MGPYLFMKFSLKTNLLGEFMELDEYLNTVQTFVYAHGHARPVLLEFITAILQSVDLVAIMKGREQLGRCLEDCVNLLRPVL